MSVMMALICLVVTGSQANIKLEMGSFRADLAWGLLMLQVVTVRPEVLEKKQSVGWYIVWRALDLSLYLPTSVYLTVKSSNLFFFVL